MVKLKLAKPMLVGVAACAVTVATYSAAFADDAQTQAMKNQLQQMQQQMQQLQQQIDSMSKKQQEGPPSSAATAPQGKSKAKEASTEPKFDKFLKGFYGALDLSVDYTTKGMYNPYAYNYGYASGAPGSPYVITNGPKATPYGRTGWLGAESSNGSSLGYRGSHRIPNSEVDFIYQVSTSISLTAAPGLRDSWTKSSNTVEGAIGLGDTFIGLQDHSWGKIRFGEMYMPYKTSTDRLNPFGSGLGNYAVVMGNTGGDNRVEFGSRSDDVVSYTSPTWSGFSFDAAYAFGQQIDPYNNLPPLGSTDCSGSNTPGSGNLPLNCDDGGYDQAFSGDLKFSMGGLYLVAAYELHKRVARSSDGIGAGSPYYGYLVGLGDGVSPMLDWASYDAYAAEYPGAAAAGSPAYSPQYDTADEWAMKFGGQYAFDFGLTVNYLWEEMKRDLPASMEFQNERQRNGMWLALQQSFFQGRDVVAVGWAHAGATPGDPGGQHNFNPNGIGKNMANMYTAQYWHKFDKQLTWYVDFAETINDVNAHYDIGAGGHGIKTDCHDASHPTFIDYSSAGPTTWGGCHPMGFSTGMSYRF